MTAPSSGRPDPLTEILLRPTAGGSMSAALVARAERLGQGAEILVRPGSVLARSRTAILTGAGRAVEVSGTRVSMAQIAAAAGVAKATLYNHFRTREEVLGALLIA